MTDLSRLDLALDRLADAARQSQTFESFWSTVTHTLHELLPQAVPIFWVRQPDASFIPRPVTTAVPPPPLSPQRVERLSLKDTQRYLAQLPSWNQSPGVLELQLASEAPPADHHLAQEFTGPLADILADFWIRSNEQQLRCQLDLHLRFDDFLARLAVAPPDLAASLLVNDGQPFLRADRLVLFRGWPGRYRVWKATAATAIDPRAAGVADLERTVNLITAEDAPIPPPGLWFPCPHTAASVAAPVVMDYVSRTGLALLTLSNFGSSTHLLVTEHWNLPPSEIQSQQTQLLAKLASVPALSARRISASILVSRRPILAGIVALLAGLIAALVPIDLTITGPAELVPVHRQNVFSPTAGIVKSIHVRHGQQVRPSDLLLELRDPRLEIELARVDGELRTAELRLEATIASRLQPGTDPTRRMGLAGEEEELRQRISALQREQQLLHTEREALHVLAPLHGIVTTWDLGERLIGRPVERGQQLLQIGEVTGAWLVEVKVAQRDLPPLLAAQRRGQPIPARMQWASDPGRASSGHVSDIAPTAEFDTLLNQNCVKIRLTVDDPPATPRPGSAAVPRINCGRAPAGYVWGRVMIDRLRSWLTW